MEFVPAWADVRTDRAESTPEIWHPDRDPDLLRLDLDERRQVHLPQIFRCPNLDQQGVRRSQRYGVSSNEAVPKGEPSAGPGINPFAFQVVLDPSPRDMAEAQLFEFALHLGVAPVGLLCEADP